MTDFSERYKPQVIEEVLNLFVLLQDEYSIPPMYSCLLIGGFCISNVLAAYERQGIQPPPELVNFIKDVLPKIADQQDEFITEQFLTLNTEGSA